MVHCTDVFQYTLRLWLQALKVSCPAPLPGLQYGHKTHLIRHHSEGLSVQCLYRMTTLLLKSYVSSQLRWGACSKCGFEVPARAKFWSPPFLWTVWRRASGRSQIFCSISGRRSILSSPSFMGSLVKMEAFRLSITVIWRPIHCDLKLGFGRMESAGWSSLCGRFFDSSRVKKMVLVDMWRSFQFEEFLLLMCWVLSHGRKCCVRISCNCFGWWWNGGAYNHSSDIYLDVQQNLLESAGIPFVGTSAAAAQAAFDKVRVSGTPLRAIHLIFSRTGWEKWCFSNFGMIFLSCLAISGHCSREARSAGFCNSAFFSCGGGQESHPLFSVLLKGFHWEFFPSALARERSHLIVFLSLLFAFLSV